MKILALLFLVQQTPFEWPFPDPGPVEPSTSGVTRLHDPRPSAKESGPIWKAYDELRPTPYGYLTRPRGLDPSIFEKEAAVWHLVQLHGKGGLPFNPKGKFYDVAGFSWGVGDQGYTDHLNLVYQINSWWRIKHYGMNWSMPAGDRFGPGLHTSMSWYGGNNAFSAFMSNKLWFLWQKYLRAAGIYHPWCLGPWRCNPPTPFTKSRRPSYLGTGR